MGEVTNRTSQTSRGMHTLSSWTNKYCTYSVAMINLGNNSISSIEIVSALNSFNLAVSQYYYNYTSSSFKYNPKVYLGAVQTNSEYWNFDRQNTENWVSNGQEKSGSWLPCFVSYFNEMMINLLAVLNTI